MLLTIEFLVIYCSGSPQHYVPDPAVNILSTETQVPHHQPGIRKTDDGPGSPRKTEIKGTAKDITLDPHFIPLRHRGIYRLTVNPGKRAAICYVEEQRVFCETKCIVSIAILDRAEKIEACIPLHRTIEHPELKFQDILPQNHIFNNATVRWQHGSMATVSR